MIMLFFFADQSIMMFQSRNRDDPLGPPRVGEHLQVPHPVQHDQVKHCETQILKCLIVCRFSAYRTAMKIRELQKRLSRELYQQFTLHWWSIHNFVRIRLLSSCNEISEDHSYISWKSAKLKY